MAQGEIVLPVDYDISKADAKQQRMTAEWNKQVSKVEQLKQKIADLNSLMERHKNTIASADEQWRNGNLDKEESRRIIAESEMELAKLAPEHEKINAELGVQSAKLGELGAKIKDNSKKQSSFGKAFESSGNALDKFGKRISGLVKRVFIFSLITKALRAMRAALGKYIEQDSKLGKSFSELKGNLAIIGTTLMETARPMIQWLLDAAVKVTSLLGNLVATIFGKSASAMKQATKETNKQTDATKKLGKAAKGALASFDEINTLQKDSSESETSSSTSYDGFGVNMPQDKLVEMATISGIALLGLGLVLLLTGANIPLGLGLTIAGAGILYSTIKENWNASDDETKKTLQKIGTISGIALVALGIILLCCGVIPLGIGLIVAGAGMLAASVALDPNLWAEAIGEMWGKVVTKTEEFIKWFRENVLDKLFGTGFGDALADMFQSLKDAFGDIIDFFKNVFAGDWEAAGKSLINIFIDMINFAISKVNALVQFVLGGGAKLINAIGSLFGEEWNLSASALMIPKIPRLATGGVAVRSTVANIGENGREAVLPLENNTDWMYMLADIINSTRGDSKFTVPVFIDGREIARAERSGNEKLGTQTVFGGFANVY